MERMEIIPNNNNFDQKSVDLLKKLQSATRKFK